MTIFKYLKVYSDKKNVNILTSILVCHGVKHIVVCPGSRNVPLVHNFNECLQFHCHSVTDERSAGFFALGISMALNMPVAVCVTSGTALLNVLPAVAEALYQHRELIVISADRPQAWIDQLDGQTIPQYFALEKFVSKSVNLPEVNDEQSRWHCNRLVNEAIIALKKNGGMPVHINVPINEPLFNFTTESLSKERIIHCTVPQNNVKEKDIKAFLKSRCPLIVIGKTEYDKKISDLVHEIKKKHVVLCEPLAYDGEATWFDKMYDTVSNDKAYTPDYVLYMGDTLVSKSLKQYLRELDKCETCMVSCDAEVHDVTMHANRILVCGAAEILSTILTYDHRNLNNDFHSRWTNETEKHRMQILSQPSNNLLKETVRVFEKELGKNKDNINVHYANSLSVRYGCMYSNHYIYVNRGVNGIEGSLSTAAGFSSVSGKKTFVFIGDLSFFYDSNALWNKKLNGNLRIILLNNGCGGIFGKLKGLEETPALNKYISASHETSAKGLCESYGVEYHSASTLYEVTNAISDIMHKETDTPILLEVCSIN
ncbi:2-succinyl-5-enolpyruvyl-6-hydroxy-3-cyclohexene-1-carboxylic-acid synthase [Prevotella sp. OH937_COT-195]|uniref:2-succinyl-5-enolpyruvyl-6-hydroxy-3- cyclohexene-1-carboxylic-acid synthase n=1 Tax=Prevotella sp. OH937_COT-195 TaxID=2491051 RepID=UPI001315A743|nr:2-succinyl-5-enolpyruvyl-6-hydroxy-3-cyclohexene-1-carboxylic-acid synthase [Prevotella sp. OH937_COT-195]